MIKIILAFSALIIVIGFFAYQKIITSTVKVNGHEFSLLLAKTEEERQIGLSKYDKLDEGKAMLFLFDKPGFYRFWMKDMKFPIDIIFIREDKISKIAENAKPSANQNELTIYFANEPVDKVLEINAGLSKKYNFKVGEKVEFNNLQ